MLGILAKSIHVATRLPQDPWIAPHDVSQTTPDTREKRRRFTAPVRMFKVK
ncbi:MAG: hypothetical protein VXZ18_08695 [Pseudomonadota bacterium]|nr:hypothetical protein [Pseudomonadota bacterium]MEC8580810.1 hypothetical protein [Pseudomonadota bacterium]